MPPSFFINASILQASNYFYQLEHNLSILCSSQNSKGLKNIHSLQDMGLNTTKSNIIIVIRSHFRLRACIPKAIRISLNEENLQAFFKRSLRVITLFEPPNLANLARSLSCVYKLFRNSLFLRIHRFLSFLLTDLGF